MNYVVVFGNELNGLEFVTYIIIPAAIILMVLVYILFNLDGLELSIGYEEGLLEKIEEKESDRNNIDKKIIVNMNDTKNNC